MTTIAGRSNKLDSLAEFTIEHAVEAVIWVDSEARIRSVNQTACKRLGYSKEALCNMTIPDINPEFNHEMWPEHWETIREKKKQTFETRHITRSGKIIPVEVTSNFMIYQGKEYDCSFSREIVKRKQLELERDRFRNVLDQGGEAIYIADPKTGDFLDCNVTACRMLGYTREEILQRRIADITKIHYLESPQTWERFLAKLEKGEIELPVKSFHIRKNGDKLPVEVNVNIRYYNEKPYLLAVARDITVRQQFEEKLKNALDEVKHLKNKLEEENSYLQQEIKLVHNFEEIICQSKVFKEVLTKVQQVAGTGATVLILGESGTGKELLARAIHNISPRGQKPLVKVNCAALPVNLIESELFGHEKGAFTGALSQKKGRFELAHQGTIFLDEIGELPSDLQTKLLRVLQEGEFERLGSGVTRNVDVRVIAATNKNLEKAIEKGEFREDLFYRLNVFPIVSPPLRERKEDIPILVTHFIRKHNPRLGKKIETVPAKLMERFLEYDWPGNVRELENIIERALIISKGKNLSIGDWLPKTKLHLADGKLSSLSELEKEHILKVLKLTQGRVRGVKGAAKILEIHPNTLESRMQRLGIRKNSL